jgi:methylenetetrahydrofolate--tRNA-(uracil-5-)-methyltransferase
MSVCWFQSRYDKVGPGGTGKDYINCPMDKDQYDAFIDALIAGDVTGFKEWEGTPYFDGCLPIEIMAERGRETLRHGPMKPMGLTNAHKPDVKAYAVVQLRQDNALGTLYNMVGFPDQAEIRRAGRDLPHDPGAGKCRVRAARRPAPQHLSELAAAARSNPAAQSRPGLRFAGQITGCEGYVERPPSACSPAASPPPTASAKHLCLPPRHRLRRAAQPHHRRPPISDDEPGKRSFQPMNVNFGLFPAARTRRHCPPRGRRPFSRQGQGPGEKAGAGSPRRMAGGRSICQHGWISRPSSCANAI